MKFGTLNNPNLWNLMMKFSSFVLNKKYPLQSLKFFKAVLNVASLCFGKLIKIPENASALQSVL